MPRPASLASKDALVTRELKLALIVGFALVLVVTVLISDHLSHARQAELAGNVPAEPIKIAEPPIIAMGDPAPVVSSPAPEVAASNAPAPTSPGTTSPAPVIADPVAPPIVAAAREPEPAVVNQGHSAASTGEHAALIDTIKSLGGSVHNGTIFVTPTPAIKTVQDTLSPLPIEPSTSRGGATSKSIAVPAAPATPDRVHTVVAGDNAFKIAKQYYGDGTAWRKLLKYNKVDEEAQLKVGQNLNIPSSEVLLGKKATVVAGVTPVKVPGAGLHSNENVTLINAAVHTGPMATKQPAPGTTTHTYTVKKGDTLAEIARHELGSSKRVHEIVELNKKTLHDPDNVPLGTVLTLPSA